MTGNRIEAVAIIFGTDIWFGIPRVDRHWHVLERHRRARPAESHHGYQGFIDSTGQFLGRRAAMAVARAAGQLLPREGQHGEHGDLFSEDVW